MEVSREFAHGAGAVRNGVFLFGRHLGEGLRVAVGNEQRVVTEALVPGLTVDDAPFDDAFEQVLLAALKQRNDRPEPCAAVSAPSRFFSSRRLLAAKSWPSVA